MPTSLLVSFNDDRPLQVMKVRLVQALPMAVEKLLRWLMLISSDADAVEFRISGVLYRFMLFAYTQSGFDDVIRVADQMHAVEEILRFVEKTETRPNSPGWDRADGRVG